MRTILDEGGPRTEESYSQEYFTDLLKRKDGTIHALEVRSIELMARADHFRDGVIELEAEVKRLTAELAECRQETGA